jgi:hypothetical protein
MVHFVSTMCIENKRSCENNVLKTKISNLVNETRFWNNPLQVHCIYFFELKQTIRKISLSM